MPSIIERGTVVPMFSCNPMCSQLLPLIGVVFTIFLDAAQKVKRDQRWVLLFGYFLFFISSPGSNYPQAPAQDLGMMFIPELQFACYMLNRYGLDAFPRCVSCTRRWAGDTCRFQEIRYFMRDADGKLLGISSYESSSISPPPTMEFPKKWNCKVGKEHAHCSEVPSLHQFYFSKPVLIFLSF